MRFFHYRATDSGGRPAEGTIRAATAAEARAALTQAGYRVTAIGDNAPGNAMPVPVVPMPTVSRPPAPASSVGSSRPVAMAAAPIASSVAGVSTAAPVAIVKTQYGRDKDLYFIFSQLAQYFKAGVAPQNAFHTLANQGRPRYMESLRDVERAVTEGKPISGALERYPYLYPPDVVGVVRAGEVSGFLGDACSEVADQLAASSRIKRRLSFFIYLVIAILAIFPIIYAVVTGSVKSIEAQDAVDGKLPVVPTLLEKIRGDIGHQLVPSLLFAAALTAFMLFWHSMPMRNMRHRMILHVPALGGRVKAEAVARFTWALGLISRGGVSPQTTFNLAALTVPNLILRDKLIASAKMMHEAERLSTALRRSETLPMEYVHIVETGEVTGDVPRALEDIHRATDADLKAREGTAVTMSSLLFYCAIGAVVLIMLAFLYRTLFSGIITALTKD